ncbi:MAG: hypothetical protein MUE40_00145 [Anaerolineae bacterium]|jgi:hypothetical protein|nr:hypothetical protein [Anaerolineae bacterium]
MPSRGLLHWQDGSGWLVFSGGESDGSPLRARALARAGVGDSVIYLSLAQDGGEALQEDLEDLGALAGYVLNLEQETPAAVEKQLAEASLIVIETDDHVNTLHHLLRGAALAGLQAAYDRGALILVEGLAINLFGTWALADSGDLLPGLDWVKSAFMEPGVTGADDSRAVQAVLQQLPEAISIEIGAGSALCLGGRGELETWGLGQVTISLGSSYQDAS